MYTPEGHGLYSYVHPNQLVIIILILLATDIYDMYSMLMMHIYLHITVIHHILLLILERYNTLLMA